jgi:pilus assembly protein Flp/PilA
MGCAEQDVVAVVPWRVAAFETGARVIMATRLKERDVMNLKNLAYYLRAKLGRDESGQDLLEYALLVALIALVCVGVITSTGSGVKTIFTNISSALTTAATP